MMSSEIILDKSYLDKTSPKTIEYLCDHHTVLLSDALFFELITTREESRERCFSRLPNRPNPVTLIPDIGLLLRFEMEHKIPCIPLSQHKFGQDYFFNRKLRDGNLVLDGKDLENLNKWQARINKETIEFINRCIVVHQFFPELNGIEWRDFPKAIEKARRKVATDHDFVRAIYTMFLNDDAPSDALEPHVLDFRWCWFRWIQCQIIAALRLFGRYQGQLPKEGGAEFWRKAEHTMLDVSYVTLGTLAGAIASYDKEVLEDFIMVCPGGVCVKA